MEQKWLKTLAALKSDDPRIYDDKTNFFDSEGLQLLINTLVTISNTIISVFLIVKEIFRRLV